ncbi:alpha/beta fold hydrolase [Nocardia rhamnosiphila]
MRAAVLRAYTGAEALRSGFAYYRAMPENARQIATAVSDHRLRVPTLALGADSVGNALYRQLSTVADDLTGRLIPACGHIIPLDRPDALLAEVVPFLR